MCENDCSFGKASLWIDVTSLFQSHWTEIYSWQSVHPSSLMNPNRHFPIYVWIYACMTECGQTQPGSGMCVFCQTADVFAFVFRTFSTWLKIHWILYKLRFIFNIWLFGFSLLPVAFCSVLWKMRPKTISMDPLAYTHIQFIDILVLYACVCWKAYSDVRMNKPYHTLIGSINLYSEEAGTIFSEQRQQWYRQQKSQQQQETDEQIWILFALFSSWRLFFSFHFCFAYNKTRGNVYDCDS